MISCEKEKRGLPNPPTAVETKQKRAKICFTFHPERNPPIINFKMCSPFYIGLTLPTVNEVLWNRMEGPTKK